MELAHSSVQIGLRLAIDQTLPALRGLQLQKVNTATVVRMAVDLPSSRSKVAYPRACPVAAPGVRRTWPCSRSEPKVVSGEP